MFTQNGSKSHTSLKILNNYKPFSCHLIVSLYTDLSLRVVVTKLTAKVAGDCCPQRNAWGFPRVGAEVKQGYEGPDRINKSARLREVAGLTRWCVGGGKKKGKEKSICPVKVSFISTTVYTVLLAFSNLHWDNVSAPMWGIMRVKPGFCSGVTSLTVQSGFDLTSCWASATSTDH